MDGVVLSGSKTRLLKCARSLRHSRGPYLGTNYLMQHLPGDSGEYLSALHNIHSLTLYNITVEHIGEEGIRTCFSAFRDTLTYLSLETFSMAFSAFVALVDHFPNIINLQLRSFTLQPDHRLIPTLSRPLRGKIHFRDIQHEWLEFFALFAMLNLEYEELVIHPTRTGAASLQSALLISANTIKFLRFTAELPCE